MNKFIWVRDCDNVQHYINTDHIIRVTKVPSRARVGGGGPLSEYSYMLIGDKTISLHADKYDTFEDVVEKIQQAQS